MTTVKKFGRDRQDKIRDIFRLNFDEPHLQQLLEKRVRLASELYAQHEGKRVPTDYFSVFFKEETIALPGFTDTKRTWRQWLAKTARQRPRDLVHMVQALVAECKSNKGTLITSLHAKSTMVKFGKERVKFIGNEFEEICPQISDITKDLCVQNTYSSEEIINILCNSPSIRSITIDKKTISPCEKQNKESAFSLLKLLHMANFVNPRKPDPNMELQYSHEEFDPEKILVASGNWNEMQNYQWEIHPAFHSYMVSLKEDKEKFKLAPGWKKQNRKKKGKRG
ncbi:MAG: hypothetical protein HQL72_03690 [Magnetococcales bacterium]|nr:hypothetical protein [Magnetococcales bacterium]